MHLVIFTHTERSLSTKTMRPEPINGSSVTAMSHEKPKAKDRLGEDIKNSISNDLRIYRPLASTLTDGPDNRVQSPENQGEATDAGEKLAGAAVLPDDCATTGDDQLPEDDEVCEAGDGVPAPLLAISAAKRGEETSENHNYVGDNGDEEVGSVHAGEETEIEKEKWCGDGPVDVSGPEDLAVHMLDGVGSVLVDFLDDDVCVSVSITSCHGEVGDGSENCDECCQDVEESLGDWDVPCQAGEGDAGQKHDSEDNP